MNRRYVVLTSALALGLVSSAGAAQLNQSGPNFIAVDSHDVTSIETYAGSVRSNAPHTTWIIASVDHNPSSTGETVLVDGCHTQVHSTSLSLASYNSNGVFLASKSNNVSSVFGCWERALSLPAAKVPPTAYLTVLARIPGFSVGRIIGLRVFETPLL